MKAKWAFYSLGLLLVAHGALAQDDVSLSSYNQYSKTFAVLYQGSLLQNQNYGTDDQPVYAMTAAALTTFKSGGLTQKCVDQQTSALTTALKDSDAQAALLGLHLSGILVNLRVSKDAASDPHAPHALFSMKKGQLTIDLFAENDAKLCVSAAAQDIIGELQTRLAQKKDRNQIKQGLASVLQSLPAPPSPPTPAVAAPASAPASAVTDAQQKTVPSQQTAPAKSSGPAAAPAQSQPPQQTSATAGILSN